MNDKLIKSLLSSDSIVDMASTQYDEATAVESGVIIDLPEKYNVIFFNDDTTSICFVVELLVSIYGYNHSTAMEKTLSIQERGRDVVGSYIKSIAEQKVSLSRDVATRAGQAEFKVKMERQ